MQVLGVLIGLIIIAIVMYSIMPEIAILILIGIVTFIIGIVLYIVFSKPGNISSRRSCSDSTVDYTVHTKVVGVTFNGIQGVLPTLSAGMPLTFIREPHNIHDKNAVALSCNGRPIGYLSAELASEIAPIIDNNIPVDGQILCITGGGSKKYGCNIEVVVYKQIRRGYVSTPPTTRELPQPATIEESDSVSFSCNDLPYAYLKAPKIQSFSELNTKAKKIRPKKYKIKTFPYPDPLCTREEAEKELRRIGESVTPKGLSRQKKIEKYVAENIDKMIEKRQEEHLQWLHDKEIFESQEVEYYENCNQIYQQDAQNKINFIREKCNASEEYIINKIGLRLERISFPNSLNPVYSYDQGTQTVKISVVLPSIEMFSVINTQKETKLRYVRSSFSIAIYIAAIVFDITPKIENVLFSALAPRRNKDGEMITEYVLSVKFPRASFEGIEMNTVQPQEFCMRFENRCNITATGIMREIKPFE